jgi:RNA polymerase sigma factor (sigma-70 family)
MTGEELQAIYVEQRTRLLRIAVAVAAGGIDGAEDAVAETFARCWRRWQTQAPDDPGAYLRRALLNELIRQGSRRTQDRAVAIQPEELDDQTSSVDDQLVARALLARLPVRQRAVLALRYLDDRTEAETAALLDLPLGTVKSTTSRALARLAELASPETTERGGRRP